MSSSTHLLPQSRVVNTGRQQQLYPDTLSVEALIIHHLYVTAAARRPILTTQHLRPARGGAPDANGYFRLDSGARATANGDAGNPRSAAGAAVSLRGGDVAPTVAGRPFGDARPVPGARVGLAEGQTAAPLTSGTTLHHDGPSNNKLMLRRRQRFAGRVVRGGRRCHAAPHAGTPRHGTALSAEGQLLRCPLCGPNRSSSAAGSGGMTTRTGHRSTMSDL